MDYQSAVAKFEARVDRSGGPDACHPWTPPITHEGGYGRLYWEGHSESAHVVALWIETGSKPEGFVCHTCNNPPCCNPQHLYDGDAATNARDREAAGRLPSGDAHWTRRHPDQVVANEKHGMARLTDDQVAAMRARRTEGVMLRVLAEQFGVSVTHVKRIVYGKARKLPLDTARPVA